MGDRVKFVGVALSTLSGKAKDSFSETVDSIEHLHRSKLFGDDRPFFVDHAVAEESGGNHLLLRGAWEQIPGNLFDQKLIIGVIAIE